MSKTLDRAVANQFRMPANNRTAFLVFHRKTKVVGHSSPKVTWVLCNILDAKTAPARTWKFYSNHPSFQMRQFDPTR